MKTYSSEWVWLARGIFHHCNACASSEKLHIFFASQSLSPLCGKDVTFHELDPFTHLPVSGRKDHVSRRDRDAINNASPGEWGAGADPGLFVWGRGLTWKSDNLNELRLGPMIFRPRLLEGEAASRLISALVINVACTVMKSFSHVCPKSWCPVRDISVFNHFSWKVPDIEGNGSG